MASGVDRGAAKSSGTVSGVFSHMRETYAINDFQIKVGRYARDLRCAGSGCILGIFDTLDRKVAAAELCALATSILTRPPAKKHLFL